MAWFERRYLRTALAAVCCLLVAGCADQRLARPDVRHRAADAMRALSTARSVTIDLDVKFSVGAAITELTGTEHLQYGGQPGSDTTFDVKYSGLAPGQDITGAEVITLGGTLYRKGFGQQSGRNWEKFDAGASPPAQPSTAPSGQKGAGDPTMSTATLFDPDSYLKMAGAGSGDRDVYYVSAAGQQEIDGHLTQGYHLSCNIRPHLAPGHCDPHNLGPIADALPDTGFLYVDYWLDGLSQPRKLTVHGVLDRGSGGTGVGIDVTMKLDRFGSPVDIEPPPDTDTAPCRQQGTGIQCG